MMLKKGLQNLGYKVSSYSSSREALKAFQADPANFDLVLTDMTMPKMTGLELTKQLLATRPEIPIVLCTGFSELITKEQAIALGIQAFLTKPILRTELSKTIRNLLDNKSQIM